MAEEFNKEHLRDKGGQVEFLKRENLPREEVYGAQSEKSDDMLDELEKDIFGDSEEKKEEEQPKEKEVAVEKDETDDKEKDEGTKEETDDVDDLLDDLINDE